MSIRTKRIFMSLGGVLLGAVSVGICKIAAFGVDPFQSLMSGLNVMFPISFGTLYVIVNGILLLFSLIFDRSRIGLATFINLFLLGYVTEFTYAGLQQVLAEPSLPVRVGCLVVGVIVLSFGSSLYMTANLGVSTYDAVALVMAENWKAAKFQYCRIATDIGCVALGAIISLMAGAPWQVITTSVGVGTIITACFMGPIIAFFNDKVSKPMIGE